MTLYAALQLVLAAGVVAIVAERCRTLLFRAPIETGPWLRAVRAALEDGDREAARALIDAARPAWVAEAAHRALHEGSDDVEPLDDLLADYRYEAFRRLRALRILASAGTASGLLGGILEVIWLFRGDHGLMALEAGRVERIALEHALLAIAMGAAISVFAFASLGILRRAATALVKDLRTVATSIDGPRG